MFSVSHILRQGGESGDFSVKNWGDFGVKSKEKGCREQETVRARGMQDDWAELKGLSLEVLSFQCLSLGGHVEVFSSYENGETHSESLFSRCNQRQNPSELKKILIHCLNPQESS